jgi:hypothetical protein
MAIGFIKKKLYNIVPIKLFLNLLRGLFYDELKNLLRLNVAATVGKPVMKDGEGGTSGSLIKRKQM